MKAACYSWLPISSQKLLLILLISKYNRVFEEIWRERRPDRELIWKCLFNLRKHVQNIKKFCHSEIWNSFGRSALKIKFLSMRNWLTRLSCFKENRGHLLDEMQSFSYSPASGRAHLGEAVISPVVAFLFQLFLLGFSIFLLFFSFSSLFIVLFCFLF